MTKRNSFLLLMIAVIGLVIGCTKRVANTDEENPASSCEGINAKFSTDILPLVQAKCATGSGCHGNGSVNGPGPLTNFTQVKNAGNAIKAAVVSRQMPLGSTLTTLQIKQVSCWVDNGKLND